MSDSPRSFQFPSLWRFAAALFLLMAVIVSGGRVAAQERARAVHVFVALADNAHQGIVPVPGLLGNGDDPGRNLYWGAAFGVRTYFRKSAAWKEIATFQNLSAPVLERAVFYSASRNAYQVADAYYVGHDGLMDFAMDKKFQGEAGSERQAIILACASKAYFGSDLMSTGAPSILWTTGLMAPGA